MIDSINDALAACVEACGGSKQVGPKLWPEKTPDAAHRQLLDCLNDDRPNRLAPDQMLLVLRMARAKGCHVGVEFICSDLGYTRPNPIDPKDEIADLLRISNELRGQQLQVSERIERALQSTGLRSVA